MMSGMLYQADLLLGPGIGSLAGGTGLFIHLHYSLSACFMMSHYCLSKPLLGEVDEDRMDTNFIIKLVILVLESNIVSCKSPLNAHRFWEARCYDTKFLGLAVLRLSRM